MRAGTEISAIFFWKTIFRQTERISRLSRDKDRVNDQEGQLQKGTNDSLDVPSIPTPLLGIPDEDAVPIRVIPFPSGATLSKSRPETVHSRQFQQP
jgi:hypothetical protein